MHRTLKFLFETLPYLTFIWMATFLFSTSAHSAEPEEILEVSITSSASNEEPIHVLDKTPTSNSIVLSFGDGQTFELSNQKTPLDGPNKFEALEKDQKDSFLTNRKLLLGAMGKLLYGLRVPIGMLKKAGIKFSTAKTEAEKESKRETLKKTFSEVGSQSIEPLLKAFDQKLWDYAPFVSKINEVGTSIEAGIAGGGKVGRHGSFIILGVGLSINVDPKEKALIFELFQDVEWAKTALPGYVGAEAFASLFGNASYHDWKEPLSIEKGEALNLPGLAGCITDRNARVGIAKGVGIGFPGAAALTSALVRIPLIRVGISPQWPTLLRTKVLGGSYIKGMVQKCGAAVSRGCSSVFSRIGRGGGT